MTPKNPRQKVSRSDKQARNRLKKQVEPASWRAQSVLGGVIKTAREEQNISMREIYKKTGVSIATLSDLEAGKKWCRTESILCLFQFLGIEEEFYVDTIAKYGYTPSEKPNRLNIRREIEKLLTEYGVPANKVQMVMQFVAMNVDKRFEK